MSEAPLALTELAFGCNLAADAPLPPCGGAGSGEARAEGGPSSAPDSALTPIPTLPRKGGGVYAAVEAQDSELSDQEQVQEPFGVYVHWPFCLAKCPYCDFNSHVRHAHAARGFDQRGFRDAYLKELSHFAALAPHRRVTSVFFGGGTPSLMAPETVAAILDEIGRLWGYGEDVEVTLEANPTSVEAGRFAGYRAAGVNRLSLGVQALNDADLKALGRQHSAAEALDALDIAKQHFGRVSFDLIYGREGQSLAAWREELAFALTFAADHLSLYQLTIEPGTPFEARYRAGKLRLPPGELAEALYETTQAMCEDAGLPAYEVSNHARPGSESRHNMIYWRAQDYAGIGPGAHSRLTLEKSREAFSTLRSPEAWRDAVMREGSGIEAGEALSASESADEYLLMGLRLAEGIDRGRHAALGGRLEEGRIATLAAEGLLSADRDRVKATPQGRMVLDRLILELST